MPGQLLTPQQWTILSTRKIFFAHMSIGHNIMAGIRKLIDEQGHSPSLEIVEINRNIPARIRHPVFAHVSIGGNEDPCSKVNNFSDLMHFGIANDVDIAFFKLCYVDIHAQTDTDKLFTFYKASMTRLESSFPDTLFLHVTVPLTARQRKIKALFKRLIGRPLRGENNRYRENFNKMLRKEYLDKGRLFDLAFFESASSGKLNQSSSNTGNHNMALLPEYTNDGCHLNITGSRRVAHQLLLFLASQPI